MRMLGVDSAPRADLMLSMSLEETSMDDQRITISAFARASRLSLKALRVYERLNLLLPVQVDDQNGYRYYSAEQIPTARFIGVLRQLELPLADIQVVLSAAPDQQAEIIRAHRAALNVEYQRRNDLALYLLQRLQGAPMQQELNIQSRFVPEQYLACLTRHITVKDLATTIQNGIQELQSYVCESNASLVGAPVVIYHGEVTVDSDGPIEVCLPYQGTLTPRGDIALRLEPGHHEAFVALTKGQFQFPAVLTAYDATCDYATRHGQSGPLDCREIYVGDWDEALSEEPVAEVAWPYIPNGEAS